MHTRMPRRQSENISAARIISSAQTILPFPVTASQQSRSKRRGPWAHHASASSICKQVFFTRRRSIRSNTARQPMTKMPQGRHHVKQPEEGETRLASIFLSTVLLHTSSGIFPILLSTT
ncbi:hypothetical protein BU26DRAFT_238487 [Trematosphaeria pertusa]|uniref:Uncharacterized protein n=1 Tax=Trematosphaeria pertusa TaxID=390896 RepID=A0A6A6HQL2_9PLEO|nr:uncharacterized protein BU26DRAFT_238487 [Trematosphaeria pertusa]KAF2240311.1 hypothetical protein BU26DRAFT_238487 [Trematosphaeria pertusa]